jgi:hypothetical protein
MASHIFPSITIKVDGVDYLAPKGSYNAIVADVATSGLDECARENIEGLWHLLLDAESGCVDHGCGYDELVEHVRQTAQEWWGVEVSA